MGLLDPFKIPGTPEVVTESPPTIENVDNLAVKPCETAREYEPHAPHEWERKWAFWCKGIPEVVDQPPCAWYLSPAQPTCGQAAPATVHIKTKTIDAVVSVCRTHKSQYDHISAQRRTAHDEATRRRSAA